MTVYGVSNFYGGGGCGGCGGGKELTSWMVWQLVLVNERVFTLQDAHM